MIDWKNIQAYILKTIGTKHVVNDVAVGQHNTFSVSGGTGGEDDHGTIGWFRTGFYVFCTVGFVDLWNCADIFYTL